MGLMSTPISGTVQVTDQDKTSHRRQPRHPRTPHPRRQSPPSGLHPAQGTAEM